MAMTGRLLGLGLAVAAGVLVLAFGPRLFARLVLAVVGWVG